MDRVKLSLEGRQHGKKVFTEESEQFYWLGAKRKAKEQMALSEILAKISTVELLSLFE